MLFRFINTLFIVFIFTISIVVLLTALGWVRLLVVKTGSMTPTLPVNSLIVIVPTKSIFNQTSQTSYKVGDIVSFKPTGEKALITHRIASVNTQNNLTTYQTKGDANQSRDQWKIVGNDVLGKVAFSFAGLGAGMNFLSSFLGLFLIVIIPATFVILHEVLTIQEELRKAREEKYLNLSKKTVAGPILVILILILATPVYASFSSSVLLAGNSLSTKESFTDHIVINEVYYQVDPQHGRDASGGDCSANNSAIVNNSVNVGLDTGGNSASGNTGGNTAINSGTASANININNSVNTPTDCGRSDEWIELYNPTDSDVNLKNWTLQDNSTKVVKISGSKILKTHGFALLSKSSLTWHFWTVPTTALKISLGTVIGNGLDNSGDRLTLKNSSGQVVDKISYGADNTILNPAIPLVSSGSSFERNPAGLDNNLASDFITKNPPTPGL